MRHQPLQQQVKCEHRYLRIYLIRRDDEPDLCLVSWAISFPAVYHIGHIGQYEAEVGSARTWLQELINMCHQPLQQKCEMKKYIDLRPRLRTSTDQPELDLCFIVPEAAARLGWLKLSRRITDCGVLQFAGRLWPGPRLYSENLL